MKAESKLEYYENVQVLPYESIQTFKNSGSRIKIQEYVDKNVHMIQYAYAEILEDNTLEISTYAVRSDQENIIIARSDYFYKEAGGELTLSNYEASQTGLIGGWEIPTLDVKNIQELVISGKMDDSNWLHFKENSNTFRIQYASKTANSQGLVTLLGLSANTGNDFGLTDSFTDNTAPTVAIYTKPQSCANTKLNLRPQQIPVFLNNIPFRVVASCTIAKMGNEVSPVARYFITPDMVSILTAYESKKQSIHMQINNQELEINLSGFSYALNKVRTSAK